MEVLSIKMLEIEQWGNTVYHLYTVCRNKYIDCYGTIVQFIRLIFGGEVTGFCDANELIKSNKGQEGIVDQLL